MQDFITVNITGLKEVEDALADLGPKLAKRALRKALNAGGQILVDGAKQRAPVMAQATPQREPGELRDSITMKTTVSESKGSGSVVIGPEYTKADGQESPGVWGMFEEFGSIHGEAQPYMRPTYDADGQRAVDAFTEEIAAGVETLGR